MGARRLCHHARLLGAQAVYISRAQCGRVASSGGDADARPDRVRPRRLLGGTRARRALRTRASRSWKSRGASRAATSARCSVVRWDSFAGAQAPRRGSHASLKRRSPPCWTRRLGAVHREEQAVRSARRRARRPTRPVSYLRFQRAMWRSRNRGRRLGVPAPARRSSHSGSRARLVT